MDKRQLKVYFVLGEESGDRLAADLVPALQKQAKQNDVELQLLGLAGQQLQQLGVRSLFDIEDIAVIISVATPHRKAAFEACQYAIDTLKETVPIWKKEIFEDGEVWVAAHP